MVSHVIEGTWEEIECHKADLIGRQLRVTILPDKPATHNSGIVEEDTPKPKVLIGRGMLAGLLSTEEYFREKREDTLREDRDL